jgi:hypothetical protein
MSSITAKKVGTQYFMVKDNGLIVAQITPVDNGSGLVEVKFLEGSKRGRTQAFYSMDQAIKAMLDRWMGA